MSLNFVSLFSFVCLEKKNVLCISKSNTRLITLRNALLTLSIYCIDAKHSETDKYITSGCLNSNYHNVQIIWLYHVLQVQSLHYK